MPIFSYHAWQRPRREVTSSGGVSLSHSTSRTVRDPLWQNVHLEAAAAAVVDTPEFQRLRRVKQLGFAHLVYPGAVHNRFLHALGVYHLTGRAIDTLERYAPGLREQIVAREFLAPADIEARYGVTGGHWHHGEFSMDQMLMMRPTYDAAQYRTPIPGLWLCGAGCHPAGDITGAAGHNAAREILK